MNFSHYVVLARKYRPTTINNLIGQNVLVTTLKNAFTTNRIAHAFLLSGIRGIGKTTTARILAKAFNCIGESGNGDLTLDPCNMCIHCTSINNDSHLDVLEMDAASKTGIDDIREIIETIKYKPLQARYKVYIIDEIHMLSKSAFNALLKTLEEPPTYVKFIFATTEIKKVPVTIISRCQRFDLRRLTPLELQNLLINICTKENIIFENNALLLIANAAEGSVRDSLSLLDQAICSSNNCITEETVVNLLGKGDTQDNYELFTSLTNNNHKLALEIFNKLYSNSVEIVVIFETLLEICHLVSMIKTSLNQEFLNNANNINCTNKSSKYDLLQNLFLTESEKKYALTLAKNLSLSELIVLWQILVKGIEEIKISTIPKKSAEMIILRITWVNKISTLPYLNKVIRSNLSNFTTHTNIVSDHDHLSNINTNSELRSYNHTTDSVDNSLLNINLDQQIEKKSNKEVSVEEVLELFPKAKIIKD